MSGHEVPSVEQTRLDAENAVIMAMARSLCAMVVPCPMCMARAGRGIREALAAASSVGWGLAKLRAVEADTVESLLRDATVVLP